jgi:hypothetical protein
VNKLLAALMLVAFNAYAVDAPDPTLTPGAARTTDPADICSTAGHKISTKDVRNVPESVKRQVFAEYHVDGGNHTGYCAVTSGCEVDHLISLELGGSNDIKNLWPQPYTGVWNAHMKDALEDKLHHMVCTGQISLPDAQHAIASNWKGAWVKYVNKGQPK